MMMKKTAAAVALTLSGAMLISCSDGGGGDKPTASQIQMSGAVVDDFVQYGTVFVDENQNGIWDKNTELNKAQTDKDGYFTYAKDGSNYCDTTRADYEDVKVHCLQIYNEPMTIVIQGGVDLATNLPFRGKLQLKYEPGMDLRDLIASPMSTLQAGMTKEDWIALLTKILKANGITQETVNDFMKVNPLTGKSIGTSTTKLADFGAADAQQAQKSLITMSYTIQKSIETISAGLQSQGADTTKTAKDYAKLAIDGVAKQLTESKGDISDTESLVNIFTNPEKVAAMLTNAANSSTDETLKDNIAEQKNKIAESVKQVANQVRHAIAQTTFDTNGDVNTDTLKGLVRKVEMVTQVAVENPTKPNIVTNANRVATQMTAAGANKTNLTAVTSAVVNKGDTLIAEEDAASITTTIVNNSATRDFPDSMVKDESAQLTLMKLSKYDTKKTYRSLIYFMAPETNAADGDLKPNFYMCAAQNEGGKATSTTSMDGFTTYYLEGSWRVMAGDQIILDAAGYQIPSSSLMPLVKVNGSSYEADEVDGKPLTDYVNRTSVEFNKHWRVFLDLPETAEKNKDVNSSSIYAVDYNPFYTSDNDTDLLKAPSTDKMLKDQKDANNAWNNAYCKTLMGQKTWLY